MAVEGGEPAPEPTGANGPAGPSMPDEGQVELTSEERRVLEGRAGRLRDYAKAAIDAGDWHAAIEAVGRISSLEQALGGGARDRDRLGDVERVLAALLGGMRKDGPHPHMKAVLAGEPVRFTFASNANGSLSVDFVPTKAASR